MGYSIGIVGTGFVAGQHARGYEAVEDADVVAACDVDAEGLRRFGEEWSVPADGRYPTHEAMLADLDLDAVSITTPSLFHHDHVVDAARSGVDAIWCEKPIALSVSDAERMVAACDDAGAELVINHSRRFAAPFRELRSLLREERLIGSVDTVVLRSARELVRNGTHSVDFLPYLLGERAEHVSGYLTGEHGMKSGVVDAVEGSYDDAGGGGTVVTADGTYVTVDHTSPRATAATWHDFVGSEGRLAFDGSDWRYWRLEEAEWDYETPHVAADREHVEADFPRPIPSGDDVFENAASHLVALLDGEEENRSPGCDAVHVLEILVAMFVSHYTGSRLALPLDRPLRDVEITSW